MAELADPSWIVRPETLEFRFGPVSLGAVRLPALSLLSNPFSVGPALEVPVAEAMAKECTAVVRYAMPIGTDFPSIRFEHRLLRYAARYGVRYVVDLNGSFSEYLVRFSNKSRNTLKRKAKKCRADETNGPELRQYRTPPEIEEFRAIAIGISRRSYKKEFGWGFDESDDFARQLEMDAGAGRVRGYVLIIDGEPAAYAFCKIENDIIIYKHLAYKERFSKRSPGSVLLYLMIEQLFREQEFKLLDFDGMEHFGYKEFFATRVVRCARVIWLRPTCTNLTIVAAHWFISALWRLAAASVHQAKGKTKHWPSARRPPRRWMRVLTKSAGEQ